MSHADDITRMQSYVGRLLADARQQAETERACSMPAGSLAPVDVAALIDDDQLIEVIRVTFNFPTMAEAAERMELIDYAAARIRHEVPA